MKIYVLIDSNFIVKSWGKPLSADHIPIENSVEVETNLDLGKVQIIDNYKLVDGRLVELTEGEKPVIDAPIDEMKILKQQLKQQEEAIGMLATQTAKNTLLNGGIR
ncbi:hypothetical protein [Niameybacter massiliensis]|uniref:hypothetical protein n=1 Tax=Niameybacter massiliensis TaxID=1658108 RepID=UPI0006B564EE|nr:hypothetical protein [Niameybacter massiliensis]